MMALISSLLFRTFLFLCLLAWITNGQDLDDLFRQTEGDGPSMVFNVMRYGADSGGKTDNSQSFLKAWSEACKWDGRASVEIPAGTFKLFPVVFSGPCNGPIEFIIKGTLLASTSPSALKPKSWISFRKVDQLTVAGGGTLDGQGASVWPLNKCGCKTFPTSMAFDFVTNASVHQLISVNSQNGHFKVTGCQMIDFQDIKISAPEDSPNTDGIKISKSEHISITQTIIQTGDDCIAMISGSRRINISNVFCGPGHGISIGSLGGHAYTEYDVEGIFVKNSVFKNTNNGLRIKTWDRSSSKPLKASNILYEDIDMIGVKNPIIIDQQYCPNSPCSYKASSSSNVQISDVTFRNISGTSASKEAVTLKCSKMKPCKNIVMENIKLPYNGPKGAATSVCDNVIGNSVGSLIPPPCI